MNKFILLAFCFAIFARSFSYHVISRESFNELDSINRLNDDITERSFWETAIAQLKADHEAVPVTTRSEYFVDMRNLIVSDSIEAWLSLDLMSYLEVEREPAVWREVQLLSVELFTKFFDTEVAAQFQSLVQEATRPQIARLGFAGIPGEPASDSELRKDIIRLSCDAYDNGCLSYARDEIASIIGAAQYPISFCDASRLSASGQFNLLRFFALSLQPEQRTLDLGCSLDEDILSGYLLLMLDSTNSLLALERKDLLKYTLIKSEIGLTSGLNFIKTNYVAIEAM